MAEQEIQRTDTFAIIGFVVSGLPLLIYPFILVANMMSFAGEHSPNEDRYQLFAAKAFLMTSLLYPLAYILGIIQYIRTRKRFFLALPYLFLALVGLLFLNWVWSS